MTTPNTFATDDGSVYVRVPAADIPEATDGDLASDLDLLDDGGE